MKKIIYILLLVLISFLSTKEIKAEDYKTYWDDVLEVSIDKQIILDETYYYVVDVETEDIIMTILEDSNIIYCDAENGVNLRYCPSTSSDRFSVIPYKYGILELGRYNGWSLVYINNLYYFVWNELFSYRYDGFSQILDSIEENPFPSRIYLGNWTVTEYCTSCNSGGSRSTASGYTAEEWRTCAVSLSNYKKLKGKWIYVEGWGEFRVEDYGSVSGCDKNNWVDLFLDTSYHGFVWSKADIYIVDK